jgi:peptide/nickel transport system substrate-binding protein
VVLEANLDYWDKTRFPKLKRIVFDNTLNQEEALELVKNGEGQVDLVTELRPLDTLRVAQSPFAKVVKNRGSLKAVFGMFNMKKTESPWLNVRLRQALNFAINREDLIRYAAKGNGVIIPAMVPPHGLGYDPDLSPYPFDPDKARHLLREAGYPDGFAITLIAHEDLVVQATVVSKMLEQVGLTVDLRILDLVTYSQKVYSNFLDQPSEQQTWDIALFNYFDYGYFPAFSFYAQFVFDSGLADWVNEKPELRQLYDQVMRTVDREQQQEVIRQMERHTSEQAYFLFLYSPLQLLAANKAVEFVPSMNTYLFFVESSVADQHWSVREEAETDGKE